MSDINTILLTGRPGSGKGTQAKRLAEKQGFVHFSTGDRFRVLREGEGPVSARVKHVYDAGRLMPDWFANYLFEAEMLTLPSERGVIFDGYPRTLEQAEIFDDVMSWLERSYVVLDLEVSDEEVIERMVKRAEAEHRPDSATREQAMARLSTYEDCTAPILDFFRDKGVLVSIDGTLEPDEVEAEIANALSHQA